MQVQVLKSSQVSHGFKENEHNMGPIFSFLTTFCH
jgi:hypothetical protein